jgi:hypothetical protein
MYSPAVWTWDGAAWSAVQDLPSPAPTLSSAVGAAYDPVAKRIIVAIGKPFDLSLDGEWITSSSPINASSLAWDAGLATMSAIAGQPLSVYDRVDDGWRRTPFGAAGATLVSDPRRASVFLVPVNNSGDASVWERRDGTWSESDPLPFPISGGAAGYDDQHGELIVLGVHDGKYVQFTHAWSSGTPLETCGAADDDGDGLIGCADDDCWWSCAPACPPETSCP